MLAVDLQDQLGRAGHLAIAHAGGRFVQQDQRRVGSEVARTAELILEINRQHALVVVEHDMNFIRMIARKVTVLHQGAIVREDTPDRIMSDPLVQQIYLGKKPH